MWSASGQHLQQACEKQMKFYLESIYKLDSTLQKTHNLRKLLRDIGDYEEDFYKTASVIENYLFDTRYLGNDYLELTKKDIESAIDFYNNLLKFLSLKTKDNKL